MDEDSLQVMDEYGRHKCACVLRRGAKWLVTEATCVVALHDVGARVGVTLGQKWRHTRQHDVHQHTNTPEHTHRVHLQYMQTPTDNKITQL